VPSNVMPLAVLSSVVLILKNSARKSAGPCVVSVHVIVVWPFVPLGALAPLHAAGSLPPPVHMAGEFWPRFVQLAQSGCVPSAVFRL